MNATKTTNILLTSIALLLGVHLLVRVDGVATAHAAPGDKSVRMLGCFKELDLDRAQCKDVHIAVDKNGKLRVTDK
jgi:hypothetical protein